MSGHTAVAPPEREFFGHPRGLSTLFFTEMWERFSYYGMRAILVLYMVAPLTGDNPGLGMDEGVSKAVYGAYTGLVYLLPIAGGWIADRVLGMRRTVLYGAIVIACGHYSMAIDQTATFWLGLLLIILGTGMLKANISGMVGQLYRDGEDARRDAGFSIFYMGINIGSLLAPLVCGTLGERYNWHLGFGAAGIGMTLGLIQYVVGSKHLHGVGDHAVSPATAEERNRALRVVGIVVAFFAIVITALTMAGQDTVNAVTNTITLFILIVPIWYFRQILTRPGHSDEERSHVRAFVWIFLGAAFFWMIFEQAGSTLTLFADNVTDLTLFGSFDMPASWLQSVNPFFIVVFAPLFSMLWLRWGNRAPRTSIKFAVALVIVGFSFLILIIPSQNYISTGAKATVWWLIFVYLLQTWAELLLSPNGLSATTKLAPANLLGQFMALWFLATSVGTTVGGQIARLTSDSPTLSFAVCGGMAVAFGVVMFVMAKKINALMGRVH